jgi:hypothetical protein
MKITLTNSFLAATLLLLLAATAAIETDSIGQPKTAAAAAAASTASVLAYSASDGCAILGSGCEECQLLRIIREDHNPSFPTAEAHAAAEADTPATTAAAAVGLATTQSLLLSEPTSDASSVQTSTAAGTAAEASVLQSVSPDAADAVATEDRALLQGYIPGPYDYAGQPQQYPYDYARQQQQNPYGYVGQPQQYPYDYAGQQQYGPGPRMYYGPHGFHGRVSGTTDMWSCIACDAAGHYVLKKMPDGSSRCGEQAVFHDTLGPWRCIMLGSLKGCPLSVLHVIIGSSESRALLVV